MLALVLMHDAAMRVSEVCNLELDHIDPERALINIWNGKHRKASEYDPVPASERLIKHLNLYLPTRNAGPTLLTTLNNNPVNTEHYAHLLARLGQSALGKHVHPHMLRSTAATNLAEQLPLHYVQKLLRHKRIETTMRYTEVRPRWADDVRKVLDAS